MALLEAATVKGNVTIGPPSLSDHPIKLKSGLVNPPLPLSPKLLITTGPTKCTDRSLELSLKALVAERVAATLDSKNTVSRSLSIKAFEATLVTVPGIEIVENFARVNA